MKRWFTSPVAGERPPAAELDAFVALHPWFAPARALREATSGVKDPRLALMAPWRAQGALAMPAVDAAALAALSSEDVIDRFLHEENLRIVACAGEPEEEVLTEARLDAEDELVSEELARIYVVQGLRDKAVAIYRQLSLLNPEKSVYFAEQIAQIENNN